MLLSAKSRKTFALVCVLFLLMAFLYYGLVLLTVALLETDSDDEPLCKGSDTVHELTNWDYLQALISNAAEVPGLLVMFLLLDWVGRRVTLSVSFALCGGATAFLLIPRMPSAVQCCFVFLARAFALSFNQSLWVYTTEVFPTKVRATALGFGTCFARIGGGVAPFMVSQVLFDSSEAVKMIILATCVGTALVSAVLSLLLPLETNSHYLTETTLPEPAPAS
eukprot:TRINITY_DN2139_c0_g1_i1.p1 TRINITY_DN2139_c0_g1~~TRINITY_DN2139_c0_g1_i1.p1  ORF type:complete len:222 (-),score=64.72 TRINITY_DN2139_c0_g1_i1:97-762(-)